MKKQEKAGKNRNKQRNRGRKMGAAKGMRRFWKKALCWGLILSCMSMAGCGGQKGETDASGNGITAGNTEGQNTQGSSGRGDASGEEGSKAADSQSGGAAGSSTGNGSGYADIQSEAESIFVKEEQQYGWPVGVQYYQGEPIQLWAVNNSQTVMPENEDEDIEFFNEVEIYLNRMDGSSELLVGGLSGEECPGSWYLAEDGSIYCITIDYEAGSSTVVKRDAEGQILYEQKQDMRITDISQLTDGRIFVVLSDNGGINGMSWLGELNPDTGNVTICSQVKLGQGTHYIGAKAEKLLLLNTSGELAEVNLEDFSQTSIMVFSGTSYDRIDLAGGKYGMVEDLRLLDDGSVELLRSSGSLTTAENLRLKEIEKMPVVIRGFHFNNGWIKERVAAFNKASESYHIILEEPGEGGDWDDFAAQTSIQIATGKGPDILYGTVVDDYIQGMIDKGGFEDLKPYMENSGILEEDYFPGAFMWRNGEKIHGVNVSLNSYRYSIDASVLGTEEEPDIETLVNALLSRQEKAAYMRFCGSGDVLEMFLEGSEDLWGMINWEEGTCDFGGELFAGMLEVAKRYPYDENQDYPVLAQRVTCDNLYHFDAPLMQKQDKTRTVGIMFDEGCYPALNTTYQIMAINANSARKQGAWEFIRFLLGDESQKALMENYAAPIKKEIFEAYIEKALAELEQRGKVSIGHAYLYKGKYVEVPKELRKEDVTQEWIDAFRQAAEDAGPLPLRTVPVLEIIREEAEDYFSGIKGIEEVVSVIENRVQLYLDENYF